MEFWLIKQAQFITIDSQPQIVHQLEMGLRQGVHGGLEKVITVSSHVLRVVHRRIGVKHQLTFGFTVVG